MSAAGLLLRVAAVATAAAVLVRLSLWQWDRARSSGRLLHYTYAVEWLLVAVALVAVVLLRRRRGTRAPDPPHDATGRLLGPPLRPGEQLPPTVRDRFLRRRSRTPQC